MTSSQWGHKSKSTLSWQYLSAREPDSGKPWTVIWDTKRRPESDERNTALEKFEASALDRARHMLRLGFIVYEIRDPAGLVFLAEAAIKQRLGLQPAIA